MRPRQIVKSLLLEGFAVLSGERSATGLPVLAYHAVADAPSPLATHPARFREQLLLLRSAGYRGVVASQVPGVLAGEMAGARHVCLTFDDAYRSVLEHAAPVLREAGFPATIFVPAGLVGGTNGWDRASPPGGWPLLDWPELRELADAGLEIGCHSATHRRLPGLDDATLADEVAGSRRLLEDRLGRPVTAFAYPYGEIDRRVREAVREAGHVAAFGLAFGRCRREDDPMALPRLGTARLHGPVQFRAAIDGTYERMLWAFGRGGRR